MASSRAMPPKGQWLPPGQKSAHCFDEYPLNEKWSGMKCEECGADPPVHKYNKKKRCRSCWQVEIVENYLKGWKSNSKHFCRCARCAECKVANEAARLAGCPEMEGWACHPGDAAIEGPSQSYYGEIPPPPPYPCPMPEEGGFTLPPPPPPLPRKLLMMDGAAAQHSSAASSNSQIAAGNESEVSDWQMPDNTWHVMD